jgi:hypothetical protein
MSTMTTDSSSSSSSTTRFGGNLPTFGTLLQSDNNDDKQPPNKKRKRSNSATSVPIPVIELKGEEKANITIGAPVSIANSMPIQQQQQLRASTYLSEDVRKRLSSGLHTYLHPNTEISKTIINLSPTYTVISQAGFIQWVSIEELVAITRSCGLCLRDDTDVEFSSTGSTVNMRVAKYKTETHRIAFDFEHGSMSPSSFLDDEMAHAMQETVLSVSTPTQKMLYNLMDHAKKHKEPGGITPEITTRILRVDHKESTREVEFDDKNAIEKAARLILEIKGWRTANLLQLRLFRSIHPHHVGKIRWCKDVIQIEVYHYLMPNTKLRVVVHPDYMSS